MKGRWILVWLPALAWFCGVGTLRLSAQNEGGPPSEVSWGRQIKPLLERSCLGCHKPGSAASGYDVSTHEATLKGGARGAAVVPGKPAESLLLAYVTGDRQPRMPLGGTPLSKEEVALVRAWVTAGAKADALQEVSAAPAKYLQAPVLTALAVSPDGKWLAVSGNGEVLVWNLSDLSAATSQSSSPSKRLPGRSERILSLAFTPDGKQLVATGGTPARFGELQLWDLASNQQIRSVSLTADTVFGGSISPDGAKVAVGGADNTVRVVELATGKELFKIGNHENWVLGTVFGVDGKRLVSVGRDRAAKLTQADTGLFLENVNLARTELNAVARHPQQDLILVGGEDRTPYLYRMDRPKILKIADDSTLIRKFDRQNGVIMALAWAPNNSWVAVGGTAKEVNLYHPESGSLLHSLTGHTGGIFTLVAAPDSSWLATAGFDGKVRIYGTADGKLRREFVPVPLEVSAR